MKFDYGDAVIIEKTDDPYITKYVGKTGIIIDCDWSEDSVYPYEVQFDTALNLLNGRKIVHETFKEKELKLVVNNFTEVV